MYAPLDVHFDEHPKFATLPLEAFGLMACAIAYCNRVLTDGFVPEKTVRGFGSDGRGPKVAAALVDLGIWARVDGGYSIVGYLDHNPSRADIEKKRSDAKKRAEYSRRRRSTPAAHAQRTHAERAAHAHRTFEKRAEPAPDSDSDSDSDSERESAHACARATHDGDGVPERHADSAPADWAADVVASVEMATGRKLEDLPLCWAKFVAWADRERRPADARSWRFWVTRELDRERRDRPRRADSPRALPEPELRAAYETGLREALGAAAVVWTSASVGELVAAVEGHARSRSTGAALEGAKRVAWVEAAAADFGAWLVAHPSEAKYLGDGSPAGFVRWLARDRLTREATEIDGTPPKRRHA